MRDMKDSGIEWVGQIPKNWKVMANKYVMHKTKEIVPIYRGEDILSLTTNGVIVRDLDAGGKMPASFDGYQRLNPGNLLMCLFDYDVTPRCIGLIKDNGITSPAYSQFIVDKDNHAAYYYYYYLMIDHSKALLHMAKNLRHSFTEEQLGMIYTPVPPVEEQHRIASFLDTKCAEIDALTADIQKEIEKLQEYRKSVITEAVTKGLDPDVEMKESGIEWIGEIPVDWNCCKQKYEIQMINGRAFKDSEFEYDGKYPILRVGNLFSNPTWYTSSLELSPDKYCNKGDLLYSWSMSYAPVIWQGDKVIFHYHIWKVLLNSGINKKYVYYYLLALTDAIKAEIHETTMGFITMGIMNNSAFAFPETTEQEAIASFLDSKCAEIDSIISDKQKQLDTLAEYRKSLIYEYVTGKKEVPEC